MVAKLMSACRRLREAVADVTFSEGYALGF
jgi:hypothetical protein